MNKFNRLNRIIIMISILVGFVIIIMGQFISKSYDPYLVSKDSWFDDFQIVDDSVLFFCHLTIDNPLDYKTTISIKGDFSKDCQSGLIQDSILFATSNDEDRVSLFIVPPGLTQLDVVFIGTRGDYRYKQDRLLPPIDIIQVAEVVSNGAK